MPRTTDYYFHAYARGVDKRTTFLDDLDYTRFFLALTLSLRPKAPNPALFFETLDNQLITPKTFTVTGINRLYGKPALKILSAVLMPNHFHIQLLFHDLKDRTRFFRRLIDSYTKYFNVRYQREGRLFSSSIKTVKIISDDQNLYLNKYIHLNPTESSRLNVAIENLAQYQWSTYPQYLGKTQKITLKSRFAFDTSYFCNPLPILGHFKTTTDYKSFINDGTDFSSVLSSKELIDQSK